MVTPEIDWWVKNVLEVQNPVYSRKLYLNNLIKGAPASNFGTDISPDDNIKMILVTDISVSFAIGTTDVIFQLIDATKATDNILLNMYTKPANYNSINLNNVYYLVESTDLNFTLNYIAHAFVNVLVTIGYIKISSKT